MLIYIEGPKYIPSNYWLVPLTCICCKLPKHMVSSNIMKHLEGGIIFLTINMDLWHVGLVKRNGWSLRRISIGACIKEGRLTLLSWTLLRPLTRYHIPDCSTSSSGMESGDLQVHELNSSYRATNKKYSRWRVSQANKVTSGVPQGSVLWKILLLLFSQDNSEVEPASTWGGLSSLH